MPQKLQPKRRIHPAQTQARQPGLQWKMHPIPETDPPPVPDGGRLGGKIALITGGDSGIGEAVALLFAREGADIAIAYLNEHRDAQKVQRKVSSLGRQCIRFAGDLTDPIFCRSIVAETVRRLGRLDVLVNNAAEQHPQEDLRNISLTQWERTFRTNLFAYFLVTQEALNHLNSGGTIINTTSVTAYRGSAHLMDYASTKGAIVSFTRSLAQSVASKGIRVNAVAPGPVWTPLIPGSFSPHAVSTFGSDVLMGRPAQPHEIAPCYLFLACGESSFMTGQVLHPNGGEIVNG